MSTLSVLKLNECSYPNYELNNKLVASYFNKS